MAAILTFPAPATLPAGTIVAADVPAEVYLSDYGDKFVESEQAGVREYWIGDPIRQRALFTRLRDRAKHGFICPQNPIQRVITGHNFCPGWRCT